MQVNHQKVVEICPAQNLHIEELLTKAALSLINSTDLVGLATVEFLVKENEFYFLEVNPRLQVEHTITEQVN